MLLWFLLTVLPFGTSLVFLHSTDGAPGRFHLVIISSVSITSLGLIVLSILRPHFLRPFVILQTVWLLVYIGTAVSQQLSFNSAARYSDDAHLSGLLWIGYHLMYALLFPITSVLTSINLGQTGESDRSRIEPAPPIPPDIRV